MADTLYKLFTPETPDAVGPVCLCEHHFPELDSTDHEDHSAHIQSKFKEFLSKQKKCVLKDAIEVGMCKNACGFQIPINHIHSGILVQHLEQVFSIFEEEAFVYDVTPVFNPTVFLKSKTTMHHIYQFELFVAK